MADRSGEARVALAQALHPSKKHSGTPQPTLHNFGSYKGAEWFYLHLRRMISLVELGKHNKEGDAWIAVKGKVLMKMRRCSFALGLRRELVQPSWRVRDGRST